MNSSDSPTAQSRSAPSLLLSLFLQCFTWWHGQTLGTRLFTWRKGRLVGEDSLGNRYWQERRPPRGRPSRRWVTYAGAVDPTCVPPDWHSWLHHTAAEPPPLAHPSAPERPWHKPRLPNPTGTPAAHKPPGSLARPHPRRPQASYSPWQP